MDCLDHNCLTLIFIRIIMLFKREEFDIDEVTLISADGAIG